MKDYDFDTVEKRRAFYIAKVYGSIRQWALFRVAACWRLRKRLPRLTAKAKQFGAIIPGEMQ